MEQTFECVPETTILCSSARVADIFVRFYKGDRNFNPIGHFMAVLRLVRVECFNFPQNATFSVTFWLWPRS